MLLQNQIVTITGAGQGNGAAIATGLARHGAKVVLLDILGDKADSVAATIRKEGGEAVAFALDVTDRPACDALAKHIGDSFGPTSVVVNNAGICPRNTIDDPKALEVWDRTIDVNLRGALNVVMAFLPALRATKGRVVNITSISAYVSTQTSLGYSTSKAGLMMLTRTLAQELAGDGIRVNAIAPGPFETPMTEVTRNDPARFSRFVDRIPMGRFGRPDELVGPALFLASDLSSYVTGATIIVDGGYLLG